MRSTTAPNLTIPASLARVRSQTVGGLRVRRIISIAIPRDSRPCLLAKRSQYLSRHARPTLRCEITFPDAQQAPARLAQGSRHESIACAIPSQLRRPPFRPILRQRRVLRLRAAMPKADIDKHRHPLTAEDKIPLAEKRLPSPPAGDALRPEERDHPHFRRLVSTAADERHDRACRRAFPLPPFVFIKEHIERSRLLWLRIDVLVGASVIRCSAKRISLRPA